MGIADLNKFLRDKAPGIFHRVHLSHYAYRRIAVDVSLFLNVLVARNSNPDNKYRERAGWLADFLDFVKCLRKANVHAVCVFDAVGVPHPAKQVERDERRANRAKLTEKVATLVEAMKTYEETQILLPELEEFAKSKGAIAPSILARPGTPSKTIVNVKTIRESIYSLRKQLFSITPDDFALVKKLLDLLSVPHVTAPLEAETLCSDLCKQGLVEGVLTKDSDTFAYGCPTVLTNIDVRAGLCDRVVYDEVLQELGLTSESFLDFCCMCGTDYNKRIPGIGPVKAYNLMKKFGRIEAVTGVDTSKLDYVTPRKMFTEYTPWSGKLGYCGQPKWSELFEFLGCHGVMHDEVALREAFEPAKIKVSEEV